MLNVLGILAFVSGCLAVGVRFSGLVADRQTFHPRVLQRLMIGGAILGGVGLACWFVTIINVGGSGGSVQHILLRRL